MVTNDVDAWVSRMAAALKAGTIIDLLGGASRDVSVGGPWPPERRIPAKAIRTALLKAPTDVDPQGLVIRGAWIDGSLDIEHADIPLRVSFDWCVLEDGIKGRLCHIKDLSLHSSRTGQIDLDQSRIEGSLSLDKTSANAVGAEGAAIGGHVSLNGASLSNPDGVALTLDGADVKGGLFAGEGFTAIGEVRMLGTAIGGLVSLNGASLSNPDGVALTLDGAVVKGGLFARNGFTATGQVRALDATIGGVDLDGATLSNPNGIALGLDRTVVDGALFAGNKFTVTGELRASGARINGPLSMDGATLSNPQGDALHLDGSEITFGLFARNGFNADGEVRALDATIGGITLNGATISNPRGDALSLDRAEVTGGLFAADGFHATGQVRALGATIRGQLHLDGASLSNPDGKALNLQNADVSMLRLVNVKKFDGLLDLTSCQIGDLVVVDEHWQELPRLASAAGFRVRDVHGYMRSDPGATITWLDTCDRFTASPWEEIARVYDRNGQPADARRIRFAAADRTTRHSPWYSKPIRWFYKVTVGYGYYPLIAAAWLLGAVLLATFLTSVNTDAFLPTVANARASSGASTGVVCPPATGLLTAATDSRCRAPGYPELKPFTYALAAVSPASAVAQTAWAPLAPGAAWLEVTLTALKLFGFLLTALLLAGLTGLLKRG